MTYAEYLKTHIEKVLPKALKAFEMKNGFSLPEFTIDEVFALPKSQYFMRNIIRFGNVYVTVSVKEKDNRMGRLKKFLNNLIDGVLSSLNYEYEGIDVSFTKREKTDENKVDILPQISYLFKVYKPKWVQNFSIEENVTDNLIFYDVYIEVNAEDWENKKTELESLNKGEDPEQFLEKKLVGYYWHQISDLFENKVDKFVNFDDSLTYGYKFIIEKTKTENIQESNDYESKDLKKIEKSIVLFLKEKLPNVLDFNLIKLQKNDENNIVILKGDLKIKSEQKGDGKKLYQIVSKDKLKDIIQNIKLIVKSFNSKDFNVNVDIDVNYTTKGRISEQLTNNNLGKVIKSFPSIQLTGDTQELGLSNLKIENPDSVINFLKNSPLKLNVYQVNSEGYNFPIYPISFTHNNFKISFEPLAPNKLLLVTFKKQFGISKKKINESKEKITNFLDKLLDLNKIHKFEGTFSNTFDDITYDTIINYKINLINFQKDSDSNHKYSVDLEIEIKRILVGRLDNEYWEESNIDDIPSWTYDNLSDEIIDKIENFIPSVSVNNVRYV